MTSLGGADGRMDRQLAERVLAESEERFRSLSACSPVGIFTTDTEGRCTYTNPRCQAICGFPFEQALGEGWSRSIHPDDRERVFHDWSTTARAGREYSGEFRFLHGDGRVRWVHIRTSPMMSEDHVYGHVGTVEDITERREAEEAPRESETRFRQLADVVPQILWMARPDGYLDYYNERWYEFTGFERGPGGDDSWKPILHPDDVQKCVDTWYNSVRSGVPYEIEYRFFDRKSGSYRWHLGRAAPIRDDTQRIVRWFGTCTDIDDQKRAVQTFRFLAEASAALATLVDYEETLQTVARLAVPDFADWCAVDLVGADGTLARVAMSHAGDSVLDRDGARTRPDTAAGDVVSVPLKTGGREIGALIFALTEPGRRYGSADRAVAEEIAYRAAVAIENARLYSELRQADRQKDEFLAVLAHELRNPLAPMRTAVELIRLAGENRATVERARQVIDRQLRQMVRLVDELLDVSRITRGKVELRLERCDLASVIQSAVETSRPLLAAAGHELTVSLPSEPIHLDADPTRLAQVFSNLLNNAAKYTDPGGRVAVNAERQDGTAVIRVSDTGIGIPPEALSRIFEMFAQADRSLDKARGGLGIGLTLARRLVQLHGGSVEARSAGPGTGSEFIVRLPAAALADSNAVGGTPVPTVQASSTGYRVLVVDDNRDAADSLAEMLTLKGHLVRAVYDGVDAVAAAAEFRPEVVLLDLGLPKLDGREAARRIRRDVRGDQILLIALSGWGQSEDRRRSREAGFDHHLVKPVDPQALDELLAHARAFRTLTQSS